VPDQIGKYRILERIGRGGMGTVFKAHDPVLDRLVALKVISSEGDVTDELKARFYREAQACAKLNHPNIVVVHDLGEADGQLYIVMEFLDGEELKHVIAARRRLSLEQKLALMTQVCDGLHYAHQKGIIHRDIKPGNIFVLGNGQVKILDFGIARIAAGSDPGLTRTGLIMGTLRYMSPEQARGRVDQRSDIFSVGAVFYELLAHRPAFDSEDPMEILEKLRVEQPPPLTELDPAIPSELAAIVERALHKDPAQRFPDLGEMRARLDAVRRGLSDEGERLEAFVRGQVERRRVLQAALAKRLGQTVEDDETLPLEIDRSRLADLRTAARELAARNERLEQRLQQAEALEPSVGRGLERLRAGDLSGALADLERVVHEVPDHARAREALQQARQAGAMSPAAAVAPAARLAAPSPAPAALPPRESAPPGRKPGGWRQLVPAALGLMAVIAIGAYAFYPSLRSAPPPPAAPAVPSPSLPPASAPPPAASAPSPAASAPSPTRPSASPRATETEASPKASAAERERAATDKRDLQATEKVAAGVAAARREAEQVDARRLAGKPWADATARESEGQAALGRREYALAQQRFREAHDEYQKALQEARATTERQRASQAEETTKLKQELERLRSAIASSREQALRSGADRLAREVFDGARAKETEAVGLEGQQQLAAAAETYRDADQRYGEALSRAQVARVAKTEADQARARMNAEKQRARPDGAEYQRALMEEARGEAKYESSAFKEAAGHFRTARGFFARAPGSDARAAADGDPRGEIRALLGQYQQAFAEKDLTLLRKVYPGVDVSDARRAFEQNKSYKLELAIQSVEVQGEEAQAKGRRTDIVVGKDGKEFRNEATFLFKLRRRSAGWVIDAVN
jgi:serine/threonine protein kinase